jgi:hypothetical protein
MLNSPVLSAPVQRALPGAAVTGGAVQSLNHNIWMTSEGADQSLSSNGGWYGNPSEGADQATAVGGWFGPSEGADQAFNSYDLYPSEGADQCGTHTIWGPSEG